MFEKLKRFSIPIRVLLGFLLFFTTGGFFISDLSAYSQTSNQASFSTRQRQKIAEFKKRQINLEIRRKQARSKIQQIRKQEHSALIKLRQSQNKLEVAKVSLRDQQYKLSTARGRLIQLEASLSKLNNDMARLKIEVGRRIRQIYKGERLSMLHMVLEARDIATFLDKLYYQQILVKKDKEVFDRLREETNKLINVRQELEYQKNNILASINAIEEQKKQISMAVRVNKDLVSRLQNDRAFYEAAENQLARESRHIESTIQRLISSRSSSKVSYAKGGFIKPIGGYISSPYGWRRHPIFGGRRFHTGVDICGPNRGSVRASNSGKVIFTGWYGGYGRVVIIDHGQAKTTLYAHLSGIAVSVGQAISKGSVVGYEGSTGYSTGPHLHFEVRINGRHTNPLGFI